MKLTYILEIHEPQTGFCQITMNVENVSEDITMITMPAWTPGSYLIRDFSSNVRLLKARTQDNETIDIQRKDKSTWKIMNGDSRTFTITYEVYAGSLSVRESHIDSTHAYVNGASVFMYLEGYKDQSVELIIKPYEGWKISTGMEKSGENRYRATNYDIFIDSPIEIGTHRSFFFTVEGKEHEIAIYGTGNENADRIVDDTKKIVDAYREMMGGLPYKRYLFIFHLLNGTGGGLEHHNSTTIEFEKFDFADPNRYKLFLSIVSHEFFHIWNVKRIKPAELGPFNYKEETHTTLLWVSEGITEFYGNLMLLRAGIYSKEDYFKHLSEIIKIYERTPGTKYESASDSSFDAWIKLYKFSPNLINSYVSYYLKGEILGMMLNSRICEYTKGARNLDELFKHMMEKYNRDGKGFTEKDLLAALTDISGLDFVPFFNRYVRGTEIIDFLSELKKIGLSLEKKYSADLGTDQPAYMGLGFNTNGNPGNVMFVLENSPAQKAGIYPGDEVVAIENFKFGPNFMRKLTDRSSNIMVENLVGYKPGQKVTVHVFRRGILMTFAFLLGLAPHDAYSIKEMEAGDTTALREKFLMG